MYAFANNKLKRPYFTKPPVMTIWSRRPSGMWVADEFPPDYAGREWAGIELPAPHVLMGGSEMSNYLEDQFVAHVFRTGTFTKPAALGVGLWGAAAPTLTDASTGATAGESTVGSYARVSRAPLDANWDATVGGDGHTSNTAALTFPTASANWNNQPCQDVGIADSITAGAGNLLLYSPLAVSKTVNNGDTAEFAAGALDVTFA